MSTQVSDEFANACITLTQRVAHRRRENDRRAVAAIERYAQVRPSAAPLPKYITPPPETSRSDRR